MCYVGKSHGKARAPEMRDWDKKFFSIVERPAKLAELSQGFERQPKLGPWGPGPALSFVIIHLATAAAAAPFAQALPPAAGPGLGPVGPAVNVAARVAR